MFRDLARLIVAATVITMVLMSDSTDAATLVATPASLAMQFASARSGDTLRLIGTFGNVRLQDRTFSRIVTLDASQALFTNTLILKNDYNVNVSGGKFDVMKGSSYNRAAAVWGGNNINFNDTTIIGSGSQVGIEFENTTNATVANGRFDGLHTAIGFTGVRGGTVVGNQITRAVADGIDIGNSHNVTASYNSCALGMPGVGVHPDCIQLWSTKGQPVQSDNVVTRNTASGSTQGFTSFSGGGGALRVSITYNTVSSLFPQGIACYDCVDSNISFNSVSTLPGAAHITNINVIGGSSNIVRGNIIHPWPNMNSAPLAAVSKSNSGTSDHYDRVEAVPELPTWAMLTLSFAAVGLAGRRKRVSGTAPLAGLRSEPLAYT